MDSPDPCIYIEDRWSYGIEEEFDTRDPIPKLSEIEPSVILKGEDITVVSLGFAVHQTLLAAKELKELGINAEVIDLRILNPIRLHNVFESVKKTGAILVVDASWESCSISSEVIASVAINAQEFLKTPPVRMNLPAVPAPTSPALEQDFYFSSEDICRKVLATIQKVRNN
jgi:pyruvate dehydrogenase E1 component beta subunit